MLSPWGPRWGSVWGRFFFSPEKAQKAEAGAIAKGGQVGGMYSNRWARPKEFTDFFSKLKWGKHQIKFGPQGYDLFPDHEVVRGSEHDFLTKNSIDPYCLTNVPFQKGICEECITKAVRLCWWGITSMVMIIPYRPREKFFKELFRECP